MKSSIKNSGEIQTKEPYIKCKWCIYALCSKILIVKSMNKKEVLRMDYTKKLLEVRDLHKAYSKEGVPTKKH